jgi:hypothetical protein
MATVIRFESGGSVRRCDGTCHHAKHETCKCICGGVNHGVLNKTNGPAKLDENTKELAVTMAEKGLVFFPEDEKHDVDPLWSLLSRVYHFLVKQGFKRMVKGENSGFGISKRESDIMVTTKTYHKSQESEALVMINENLKKAGFHTLVASQGSDQYILVTLND